MGTMSGEIPVSQQHIYFKKQEDSDQHQDAQGCSEAESNNDTKSAVVSWRDKE